MERRTVQLRVGGQTYRVVTSASDGELKRLASSIDAKLGEVDPRGRASGPQQLLLAALALANDLEQARERVHTVEARSREVIARVLERVDAALDEAGAPSSGDGDEAPAPTS